MNGESKLWDLETGGLRRNLRGATEHSSALAATGSGSHVALAGWSGAAVLTLPGGIVQHQLTIEERILSAAFQPGSLQIALGHRAGALVWDCGKRTRAMADAGGRVDCVAYSPDGTVLAGGCADGGIRIWIRRPAVCCTG